MSITGLMYIVMAAVAYGVMPIWVKLAYMTGLSPYEVLFLRGLLGAFFLYILIRGRKAGLRLERCSVGRVIFVGVCGYTAAIITLYHSYNYISAGVATALHYLFPVMVMVLAVVFYRERLYLRKVAALIAAVVGVYCMTAAGPVALNATGVLLAMVSAFAFALYVMGVAHPSLKAIDDLVLAFYLSIISAAVSFILVLAKGEWPIPLTGEGLLYIVLLAVFCTALALLCFNRGVQLVGPSTASILSTLEPVVSLVAGTVILRENISFPIVLGVVLVLGAVVILAWLSA